MQGLQKQVGDRIRELREARGLSQEALAALCNLHRTYVGLIERGERNLSLSTLEGLAAGLEVPVAELFIPSAPQASRRKPPAPARTRPEDIPAHIRTIRQILMEAKLTDTARYDALYDANRKNRTGRN